MAPHTNHLVFMSDTKGCVGGLYIQCIYNNSQPPTNRFFKPTVSVQGLMHFGAVRLSFMSKGTSYCVGLVATGQTMENSLQTAIVVTGSYYSL